MNKFVCLFFIFALLAAVSGQVILSNGLIGSPVIGPVAGAPVSNAYTSHYPSAPVVPIVRRLVAAPIVQRLVAAPLIY